MSEPLGPKRLLTALSPERMMLPLTRSRRTRVGCTAALLASMVLALPTTAGSQTKRLIVDPLWSGSARCQVDVQGPGYAHQETHTWTLSGSPPTRQGAMRIYPGTWSVSGQGSLQKSQGQQSLSAQWTTKAELPTATVAVFVRASDGKLILKPWHAQLRSRGGVTGSQRVTINGVVQSPEGVISLEAFEWAFPTVQGSASATSLSGSSTSPTNGSVGPMQPGGSHGTSSCTWQFQKQTQPTASTK